MKSNILVTGGTGKTGRRIVHILKNEQENVFVGSRHNTPAFDWNDQKSYANVLKGMDSAYIAYTPDLAVPGAKEAIQTFTELALKEGLDKVVLLSGKGEKEAEACEEIVANSGLNYTIVRASWFNQNFSESVFSDPILAGHVALPMAEAEIPFVDADDIAEVVAKALRDNSLNGQIITVTGPRKLTFKEAVQTIAKATNRTINFQAITLEQYLEGMENAGVPADFIWLFGYLFKEVLGNADNQTVSNDIESILGRKAMDFTEFAQKTAATGIWNQTITQAL
ncbi:NAD(P)H azoreductase [Kordia sp. SMS9]|uniref:NmrA family NAD(P)-binding protein n=1 Tax=Kordia sp. SMS9 TaxID=2282170 RepID=UPI000E0D1A19|nr:NmrA family NAD(P)-binding protein [Kordia sp. SMS9]AXG70538.1 NAD(P)H azoreductase [Kordia sp. SMS9]